MTTPDTPEHPPIEGEAFEIFTTGRWESLDITDPEELKIRDQIREYLSAPVIPERLLWEARAVWERNKDRIVADWEAKLDQA